MNFNTEKGGGQGGTESKAMALCAPIGFGPLLDLARYRIRPLSDSTPIGFDPRRI